MRCTLILTLLALLATGCAGAPRSEVIVLGMIHGSHRQSELYGIQQIQQIVRRVDPDFILCEIPPDRIEAALTEYRSTGEIAESRVVRFPEYVEAIIPLEGELSYELVPCAAWTQEMATYRREKLATLKTTRSRDYAEMSAAQERADEQIRAGGQSDDPRWIHTDLYDGYVREGMEPYNRHFNDDLGLGGWDNINAAHFALIEKALEAHRGEGKRFLVTFGSWHKYWFLEQLRARADVRLLEVGSFLDDPPAP